MNRKQRREREKENQRANSKKNFIYMGKTDIPVDKIQDNPDLKECDPDILELIEHRFEWAEQGLISNDLSKCIIMKGCSYLDSLCSLRFDITLPDDRMLIRDTMYYVGNFTNMFYGLLIDEEVVDNVYANYVAEHAQELSSLLQHTRKSDVEGDEEFVLEVLDMILKKTDELLPEAQVNSSRYVVKM